MPWNIMIKNGNSVATGNWHFVTEIKDDEVLVRDFETKEEVKKWLFKSIDNGTVRKPDILLLETAKFGIDIKFDEDEESKESESPENNGTNGDNTENDSQDNEQESSPEQESTQEKFNVSVTKLAADGSTHVPNDENIGVSTANQNAIEVTESGENEWTVSVTGALQAFTSTSPSQADTEYEWIGLMVDTGLDDIRKVSVDGNQLTDEDVAEAESVGVRIEEGTCGSFILWLKAESLRNAPCTLSLSADDMEDVTLTIKIV